MDSTTAALEHSRRRIDQTQHEAATAIDLSKSVESEALEHARRLADYETHEQRVDLVDKAEHELSAISRNAGAQEQKVIKMAEAYAYKVCQAYASCLEADCERQRRALYDRFQVEKSLYEAQIREANAEIAVQSPSVLSARTEANGLSSSNALLAVGLRRELLVNCKAELAQRTANTAEVNRLRFEYAQSTRPTLTALWLSCTIWRLTCSPTSKDWLPISSRRSPTWRR